MHRPLLSICIPTWNRQEWVLGCVRECLRQISESNLQGIVEVVVSDNASSDSTRPLLLGIQDPCLSVFSNLENLGIQNFEIVVQRALGEYVWLMGDDDLPTEGSIRTLVESIQTNPRDWYILPCEIEHKDGSVTQIPYLEGNGDRWSWDISKQEDLSDWLSHTKVMAGVGGLLSSLSGKRDLLLKGYTEMSEVKNAFPHLGAMLFSSTFSGKLTVMDRVMVRFRSFNDTTAKIDPWERIMMDLRAWVEFGSMKVNGNPRFDSNSRDSWNRVLRSHHGLLTIVTLSIFRDEAHPWETASEALTAVGYHPETIELAGLLPFRSNSGMML